MLKIGCHLSSSKGFLAMGKTAEGIGANTFQFFTRNPRGGAVKPLNVEDIEQFRMFAKEKGFAPILAHASYTVNPCSGKEEVREFAKQVMKEDLSRLEFLPGTMYNFHPGSHVKQGIEVGIAQIAELLNEILTPELHTTVLLETMAGKGTEVGRNFEEIAKIIERVECKEIMGVCMDTCHVHDGGYDIVSDLDGVLKEFDRVIGIGRLKAMHLNDSKNARNAHKDRHEKIGEGYLGLETFQRIVTHPILREIPFYLETPNELEGYRKEISLLKNMALEG